MPAPELTHTGQRLYDALAPLAEMDAEHGYALALYCGAWATVLDQVADLSRDTDDAPGWSVMLEPDATPFVEWLSQFPGVQIPRGLDDAGAREWVRSTDGRNRGKPTAIAGAAKPYLTGLKRVLVVERHGSAYQLQVTTWESETPDPSAVKAAVEAQTPGGIVLTYDAIKGGDWKTLKATHADWNAVKTRTWNQVLADPSK